MYEVQDAEVRFSSLILMNTVSMIPYRCKCLELHDLRCHLIFKYETK
jgi:hypothetical protein